MHFTDFIQYRHQKHILEQYFVHPYEFIEKRLSRLDLYLNDFIEQCFVYPYGLLKTKQGKYFPILMEVSKCILEQYFVHLQIRHEFN